MDEVIDYAQSLRDRAKQRILGVVRRQGLSPEDCWPWDGKVNAQGYGKIWDKTVPGKEQLAHRVVYEALVGRLPAELCVLHRCDNPRCCNPKHLRPGTRTDNARERDQKHRQVHGEAHYGATLTNEQVQQIRDRYSTGETTADLARAFGAERKHIWKIVTHKIRRNG